MSTVRDAGPAESSRRLHVRLWTWFIVSTLLLVLLSGALPVTRNAALRAAARLLVTPQRSVHSADVIVVAIDAQGAGTLEAADLVHEGIASRVAVFDDPPTASDREFIRRGLPYDDRAAISVTQLHLLGVPNVERVPRYTSGSEQEGLLLPGWCIQRGYRSLVLVTSTDHSRRLARIMRRATRDRGITVVVLASRYSNFDPDRWWTTRYGARTEIIEFEKLLLDVVRHPFS
ncbi:MAG: hypothetical protein ACLGXA_13785 [Acidobacteriota bacterium]